MKPKFDLQTWVRELRLVSCKQQDSICNFLQDIVEGTLVTPDTNSLEVQWWNS